MKMASGKHSSEIETSNDDFGMVTERHLNDRKMSCDNCGMVTNRSQRVHRSAIRPFICCGSELSLVSVVELPDRKSTETCLLQQQELVDCEPGLDDQNMSCELCRTHTTQEEPFLSSQRSRRTNLGQPQKTRKNFWLMKLRGKLSKRPQYSDYRISYSDSKPVCQCDSDKHCLNFNLCDHHLLLARPAPCSPNSFLLASGSKASRAKGSLKQQPANSTHRLNFQNPRHLSHFDSTLLCSDEDIDKIRGAERLREMEEGIEIDETHFWPCTDLCTLGATASGSHLCSPFRRQCSMSNSSMYPSLAMDSYDDDLEESHHGGYSTFELPDIPYRVHTQVDYIHCLVPDLLHIANCSFYWGVMDRYEAEKLLENKPEGTFLLRDSAQEEFLFSVSFRRYGRSLHARIEQWNHKFSFDSHDPGVFAAASVCKLIEHYKDPTCCMFFEPMLTLPLNRTFPFSLQHLCRAAICSATTYDGIIILPLPKSMKEYLKYYHYKQKVKVKRFDVPL